jgi:hypothetical protein
LESDEYDPESVRGGPRTGQCMSASQQDVRERRRWGHSLNEKWIAGKLHYQ